MTKTVTKNKVRSIEPLIADLANGWMKSYNLDYKLEQEPLNTEIDKALDEYLSKSGGKGGNRPDAKLLLQDKNHSELIKLFKYQIFCGKRCCPLCKRSAPPYELHRYHCHWDDGLQRRAGQTKTLNCGLLRL